MLPWQYHSLFWAQEKVRCPKRGKRVLKAHFIFPPERDIYMTPVCVCSDKVKHNANDKQPRANIWWDKEDIPGN